MDINSLLSTAQAAVLNLQAGVAGVSLHVDTSDLATVMGPAVKAAGVQAPSVLQARIKDDDNLTAAIEAAGMTDAQQAAIRKATRLLMDCYAKEIADAVSGTILLHVETDLIKPTLAANKGVNQQVQVVLRQLTEVTALASRLESKCTNAVTMGRIESEYDANVRFVTKFSKKLTNFDAHVAQTTEDIDELMCNSVVKDVEYATRLKALQDSREAIATEKKYAEKQLVGHFDGGATDQRAGIKLSLNELIVPANLTKGKGVEFIKNTKNFLKCRAPWYYAVLSEVIRTLEEASIGNHHAPPSKADGYQNVPVEFRDKYVLHAQELYDYLESKVGKDIMANIRKSFKYGMEEKKACCEIGDGPMAIFCILALYRPSGEAYREEVKEKICALPAKFTDGTNPAQKVNDSLAILQEALDLDVKIPWNKTGKLIVSLLSERTNTFARVLTPYAEVGAILDKEDSAVELKRMFADIVDACKELQESGQDVKRLMQVDVRTGQGKGSQDQQKCSITAEDSGDKSNPCHFEERCTRNNCTFGHTKEQNVKRIKNLKKGKGAGKGKGGKGKGSEGKGKGKGSGKSNQECLAKGCKAPSLGFRFCTKCHRKGLEDGGAITLKDGSQADVKVSKATQQDKRIAQLEKQLNNQDDGSDSDGEPEKKRKRIAFTNRDPTESVMDRLGLPNKRHHH